MGTAKRARRWKRRTLPSENLTVDRQRPIPTQQAIKLASEIDSMLGKEDPTNGDGQHDLALPPARVAAMKAQRPAA